MDGWIVIPNWDKFQYRGDRELVWIKLYLQLRSRDEWRELTLAARGLLVCIWVEYAASHTQLSTHSLPTRIGQKVHRRTFDSLLEAGFIQVSGAKPAPRGRLRKEEEEKRNPLPPSEKGDQDFSNDLQPGRRKLTAKELRRYTGCRWTRGSHGQGYAHDPLGTDPPPKDWPHPKPEPDEIKLHLEIQDR